jgi:hypothetical protein
METVCRGSQVQFELVERKIGRITRNIQRIE